MGHKVDLLRNQEPTSSWKRDRGQGEQAELEASPNREWKGMHALSPLLLGRWSESAAPAGEDAVRSPGSLNACFQEGRSGGNPKPLLLPCHRCDYSGADCSNWFWLFPGTFLYIQSCNVKCGKHARSACSLFIEEQSLCGEYLRKNLHIRILCVEKKLYTPSPQSSGKKLLIF